MNEILKTACSETIKNSSFKNYKSISIKLFNIINKEHYYENMNHEDIMIGFGRVINKFETLKNYLKDEKNNFKPATKKNYINNLLNVILKINNIDNYCIKHKKKLQDIKNDIRSYWDTLRKELDIINVEKKNKQQELDNEIEKSNTESEEEEEEKDEEPFVELTSVEEIENIIQKKQIELDLNMLEYQQAMLEKEKKCIEDKLEYIKNTIQYRKEQFKVV